MKFNQWPEGTAEVEAIIRYGRSEIAATTTDLPPSFTFDLAFAPDQPGTVLLKFRDADRNVIGAQGTGISAGNQRIEST